MNVDKLLEYFRNQNRMAIALDISRQAVSQFFKIGKVPPGRAIQIEQITKGRIKAVDLI